MMQLTKLERITDNCARIEYEVSHHTNGPGGTCLTQPLTLFINGAKTECSMQINDCVASAPKEALERMVAWLRRLADGIEDRKEISIPL